MSDTGPASFFLETTRAFSATILAGREQANLIAALCAQAFDIFEQTVARQAEGAQAIACQGECAACCRLRVVATAPEIFLLSRFVEVNSQALEARNIMLAERIDIWLRGGNPLAPATIPEFDPLEAASLFDAITPI